MAILSDWYANLLNSTSNLTAEFVFWIFVGTILLVAALCAGLVLKQRRSKREQISAEILRLEQEHVLTGLRHSLEMQQLDAESKQTHLTEQLGVARRRLVTLEDRLQDAQAAYHSALNERDVALEKNKQIETLERRAEQLTKQLDSKRTEHSISQSELSALTVKLTEERKAASEKLKVLEDARERLTKDFEVLANRIFDDKSEKMEKRNKQTLESTLTPLREQLTGFKQKVEDVYDKETRERLSLLHEVNSLKDLNKKMSSDALNLTKALKGDNKIQGNWGELVLERVLEDSGLKKGREYELQLNLASAEGKRRLPDVIVHLPDERDLVIDSKVSLLDYERYCSSDDENEKRQALQAHTQSMRRHVKSLSVKDYAGLEGIRTLDFVFVFVPIEPAFLLAFEHDQGLFQEAYDQNVIVVSPTTLLSTLRTVQNLWRYDDQNKNAEKIADRAGALHDQFVLVLDSMDEMGRQLSKAGDSYEAMMKRFSSGRGNLINRTKELEKLGAKTKRQIPTAIGRKAEAAGDEADADQVSENSLELHE